MGARIFVGGTVAGSLLACVSVKQNEPEVEEQNSEVMSEVLQLAEVDVEGCWWKPAGLRVVSRVSAS